MSKLLSTLITILWDLLLILDFGRIFLGRFDITHSTFYFERFSYIGNKLLWLGLLCSLDNSCNCCLQIIYYFLYLWPEAIVTDYKDNIVFSVGKNEQNFDHMCENLPTFAHT